MRAWLDTTLPQVPPPSGTGKALNYVHNEWDTLICYLDDGRLEIDNNAAENAIRPFVIGINWMFSNWGSIASASVMSVSMFFWFTACLLDLLGLDIFQLHQAQRHGLLAYPKPHSKSVDVQVGDFLVPLQFLL